MPGAENIQLDEQSQQELKSLAASRTSAVRLWQRATIVLELAAGKAKQEIAKRLGVARQTVLRLEQRFLQRGMDGLNDAPRPGRPATIGPEKIAQIVRKTTHETPGRFHSLEHAKFGSRDGSERLLGKPDLAKAQVAAASGEDVQIEQ
jgi:hypothetical protein